MKQIQTILTTKETENVPKQQTERFYFTNEISSLLFIYSFSIQLWIVVVRVSFFDGFDDGGNGSGGG